MNGGAQRPRKKTERHGKADDAENQLAQNAGAKHAEVTHFAEPQRIDGETRPHAG